MSSADTNRRHAAGVDAEALDSDPDPDPDSDSDPDPDPEVGAAAGPSAKRIAAILLVACVTLLAAEGASRVLVALAPTPHSYDAPRNPDFRRGWRDYTSPSDRPEGTRLVIVISNSQGFLRENPDGELAYPALLRELLASNQAGEVIVANWSVAGGQAPEMIVLAARAAQHRPDAVVLVTGAGNFAPLWESQPLSFWLSDAADLAYLPEVRGRLSEGFLERSAADDPLSWIAARTGIGRARKRFFEKRDEAWTWREKGPSRLADVAERTLDQRGEGFTLGVGARPKQEPAARPAADRERERATAALLDEFDRALRGTSPETRLLVVSMPIARPEQPGSAWYAAADFHATAARALEEREGVRVVDAIGVVDPEHFVRATHLQPAGHRRFAEWLVPHVKRVLEDETGSG